MVIKQERKVGRRTVRTKELMNEPTKGKEERKTNEKRSDERSEEKSNKRRKKEER
jgi:hypothetical protein